MQRLLLICFLVVAFASCQKEIERPRICDFPELKQSLKDSLTSADYKAIDFSRVAHSEVKQMTLIRVAFKGKSMAESFLLAEVDPKGKIKRGRIVQLSRTGKIQTFNGNLIVTTLKGVILEETPINNGYRQKDKPMARVLVQPDPYVVLPEVVVVASYPPSGGFISWGTWYNLISFFEMGDGGSGGWSGWYWNSDPFSGGGGGSGGTGSTGDNTSSSPLSNPDPNAPLDVIDDEILEIDFESQYDHPAIELDKYLKCFSEIPDAGATCRITVYADVPVDSDPTKIMNWETGSPGHTWIRLEKTNGLQSASQHIGFYPKTGWKTTLSDAPLDGKWVDNSNHEFNAEYVLTISPESLQNAIVRIQNLARFIRYDIDDYNCTDWAIEVWRQAVSPSVWFDIPRFQIPGSLSPTGTSTPQGLFLKLREMKQAGTPGVTIPVVGYSGNSTGPCN